MAFNNNNRKGRGPGTPASQRVSESQKREISLRLKAVDKLIRDGNLDEAARRLDSVRVMDPRNGYILALAERIGELRKEKKNPQTVEPPKEAADEPPAENDVEQIRDTGYHGELTEQVHKIEERVDAEYRDSLMEEIRKSEQKIMEVLKEERDRHDAETAALIKRFDKEKENLLEELKKETSKLFEAGFKKADDTYRKLLADQIRKTEEKSHTEISALHEKTIAGLKGARTKEGTGLSDKEREAIVAEITKRAGDELQTRLTAELAKARTELASKKKVSEEKEMKTAAHVEEEPRTDQKNVGGEIEARLSGLKKASEERYKKSVEEARKVLDKHLAEIKLDDPKSNVESESKLPENPKEGEADSKEKPEEQFAKKRAHMDNMWGKEFEDLRKGVDWEEGSKKKEG